MITYLINFTLCSALLLATYQLLLKNKTTYVFNRFYLLAAMAFSLTVPLITVTRPVIQAATLSPVYELPQLQPAYIVQNPVAGDISATVHTAGRRPAIPYILAALYAIVTLLLLCRFAKSMAIIRRSVLVNECINYKKARLILIDERLTPHTFLTSIFINKDDYRHNRIEADVLKHELAHAHQHHSADIIFIELVQVFCWFNPFIILYRRAIQLNHEFIADAAVLGCNHDVRSYQYLLLARAGNAQSLNLTSRFNYSATKKRLIMMNKNTSAMAATLARLAVIPVIAAAFILFCTKTGAQQQPAGSKPASQAPAIEKAPVVAKKRGQIPKLVTPDFPSTKEGISEEKLKEYAAIVDKYDNPKVRNTKRGISKADYDSLVMIYKQMSHTQQQQQVMRFLYYKQPLAPSAPAKKDYELWKDAATYGIWLNDKHVSNTELDNYKAGDFKLASVSRLLKAARVNKSYKYQVDLMTADYFDKYNESTMASPPITIIQYGFSKPKASPSK